eukprot:UN06386
MLWRVFGLTMTVIVSSVDALPIHGRKVQTFLGLCAVVATTTITVYWYVTAWEFKQETDEKKLLFNVSLKELASMRNALGITLALFFLKQSVFSYTKGDRCISINYSPKINWICLNNEEQSDREYVDRVANQTPDTEIDDKKNYDAIQLEKHHKKNVELEEHHKIKKKMMQFNF